MKKMTLQEIQQLNLEMMKEIHAFCVKKGLRYSLAYGSMIGAIRHKGFIPWDDDIDIMMPRPDYERFTREYRSEKGYRVCSAYDDDAYVNFTMVYDTNTIVQRPGVAAKYDTGVWIDIFPIDAVSDDEEERESQFQHLRQYTGLMRILRASLSRWKVGSLKDRLKASIRLLQLKLFTKGDYHDWHRKITEICTEHPFGSTKHCSSLLCVEANTKNKQEVFDMSDFQDYELMAFEDQTFYVASGYDHILSTIFGDYMAIPPVEKQIPHALLNCGFYWK